MLFSSVQPPANSFGYPILQRTFWYRYFVFRSDESSIVELLKDHSIRCNRGYSDCVIYTLPLGTPQPSEALIKVMHTHLGKNILFSHDNNCNQLNPYFVQLEKEICQLILQKNLHWRHFEMAVGMLFSLIIPGYKVRKIFLEIMMFCQYHWSVSYLR